MGVVRVLVITIKMYRYVDSYIEIILVEFFWNVECCK